MLKNKKRKLDSCESLLCNHYQYLLFMPSCVIRRRFFFFLVLFILLFDKVMS